MLAAYDRLFGSRRALPSGARFRSKGIAVILAALCANPPTLRAEVLAYIPQPDAGTVTVLNSDSGQVMTTVKVGANPIGVAVDPQMQTVYVTNSVSGTVSMINMKTNKVVNTIRVGNQPMGVAVTPDGSRVYVANAADNTVSWFVAQSVSSSGLVPATVVVSTIPMAHEPYAVAASSDGTSVYVTLRNSNQIAVISTATNTVTSTISTGSLPTAIAETHAAYPTRGGSCIDVNCAPATKPLVWSADYGSGYVDVFGANATMWAQPSTISTGQQPLAIGTFPFAGSPVYVANNGSNSVTVIDPQPTGESLQTVNFPTEQINLSAAPTGVAGTPDGKFAWIVANDGTVAQVRTAQNKVVQYVPIGYTGSGLGQFVGPRLGRTDLPPLIRGSADLQLTVAWDASTLTVYNDGPNVAAATELTVNLPGGVTFVSAKPSQGGCVTPKFGSAGVVRCNLGALAAGEAASLVLDVRGAYNSLNAVVSDAFSDDPVSTNNTVTWGVNYFPIETYIPPPPPPGDFTIKQVNGSVQVQPVGGVVAAPYVIVNLATNANSEIGLAFPSPQVAQWLGCEWDGVTYMKCPLVEIGDCDSAISGVCRLGEGYGGDYSVDNYNANVVLDSYASTSGPNGYPGVPYAAVILPVELSITDDTKNRKILSQPVIVNVTNRDGTILHSFDTTLGAVALVTNAKELGWVKPPSDKSCEDTTGVGFGVLLGSCSDSQAIKIAQFASVLFATIVVAAALPLTSPLYSYFATNATWVVRAAPAVVPWY